LKEEEKKNWVVETEDLALKERRNLMKGAVNERKTNEKGLIVFKNHRDEWSVRQ
jgi:hypothetical protein